MNTSINCGLKGQYKVDIFRGGGKSRELAESTDWFSNDITNVGLNYPFTYPFAKCFMFLSIGTGLTAPTNNSNGTGLATGLGSFSVYNPTTGGYSRQSGQYIGWEGYEIGGPHDSTYDGSLSSACGTVLSNQGVNLYRGWTIPTGSYENGNTVAQNMTINQFMTSPSSGSDVNGNKAFSLVSRTIVVPSGYSATITYQLSINFSNYASGYTFFSGNNDTVGGYFNTGNASTGANGSNEFELLSGWSTLSGIYRQIFPAIQMIDGVGACVIPKMGADLEPSKINCQKSVFYLSPDISQFAVNKFGGASTGEYGAYNSYGLMANYAEFVSQVGGDLAIHSDKEDGSIFSDAYKWYYSGDAVNTPAGTSQNDAATTEAEILSNIRLEGIIPISNYNSGLVSLNYQTKSYIGAKNSPVAFATPGRLGFNSSFSDYGQRAVYSSYLKRLPIDISITGTGTAAIPIRNKYVTKRSIFSPINSYGTNSRYGSLTLGYNTATNTIGSANFHPYIDFLFFDDQGKGANMPHYRLIPDIYLVERGSGVASVRFDITGVNGSQPSSVNRFWTAYGFMGNGVSVSTNPSGINEGQPLLNQVVYEGSNIFIPRGNKKVGYLFTGQVLNENVPGNIAYNGNTGWGSVYGVIADTEFYSSQIDTCLVDNPSWTGFNGGIPNSTGSNVYWPTIDSGIGVRITGVGYFCSGYSGSVNGIYSNPIRDQGITLINDVLYNGQSVINNLYMDTIATGNVLVFGDGGAHTNISMEFLGNPSYLITGYTFNTIYNRGSGLGLSLSTLNQYTGRPASNFGSANNQTLTVSAIAWKKPSGVINHVENIGNLGYRMLPNYATANNAGVNTYLPVTGGKFPGMSTQNGMELYLTLSWTGR